MYIFQYSLLFNFFTITISFVSLVRLKECSLLCCWNVLKGNKNVFFYMSQKGPEYSHRNLASGHCGENLFTSLAVLLGLIVKLSPWANLPWGGMGPTSQSLGGGGCCKSVVWSASLALGESVHLSCVCFKFFMPNLLNDWGPQANYSIFLIHVLGWGRRVRSGGVLALNSLLRACLSLKHPLSCKALEQLECMAKSILSFDGLECFFANKKPRTESP